MSEQDTICAVSTPVGAGGIGIIRLSGARSLIIAGAVVQLRTGTPLVDVASHTVHYGHIQDPAGGGIIDEVIVTVMRAPRSYTREDVVEINCHGGTVPLLRTMRLLVAKGARQADPGEFTKRAFLNGRLDLAQAEAVMDIIQARTEESHAAANELLLGGLSREICAIRERLIGVLAGVEAAVDFPEEDIETPSGRTLECELQEISDTAEKLVGSARYGRVLREGFATAIAGRPNVGKSSLLNALLKQDRAIVTDVPGTTRDLLEEYLNVGGMPLRIVDTAGIRHSSDFVEQEGVRRSLAAVGTSDIVLIVLDGSTQLTDEDRRVLQASREREAIAVINKSDLPRRLEPLAWPERQVEISCRTGSGLDDLRSALLSSLERGGVRPREHIWAVNHRHEEALTRAVRSMERALASVRSSLSPEFIALDLRDALDHIGSIVGVTYTEDILERIFRDFCIGK